MDAAGAKKFVSASLDDFDADALLSTLTVMEMVVNNDKASDENKFNAYAVYGKVSLELDARKH
jgi:hypothetical protein